MARLNLTTGVTCKFASELERDIAASHQGMAHFANTGPFGATCGECAFYGYWRQHRNQSGDVVKTVHRQDACKKFFQLTGKHGASVPPNASACRYFEKRA